MQRCIDFRHISAYKPDFAIALNASLIGQTQKRETPKGLSEIAVTTFAYSAAVKLYLPKS